MYDRGEKAMVQVNESEVELSRQEILALIDEGARHRLGISGEKLLELYRRGQLRDLGEVADLLVLATLLEDQAAA
jgi:hypothetical protein